MRKITTCLWFDHQGLEAAKFYVSLFKNSKIHSQSTYGESGAEVSGQKKGSIMTVEFDLEGRHFMALNGGPIFTKNPSISFFAHCATKAEVDSLFKKLSVGGKVMMPLDKYPFSERYAFVEDKFGVSWQIMLSPKKGIQPCLLFVNKSMGHAEAAVKFYTGLFDHSNITAISHYGKGEPGKEGTVKHCSFSLEGQDFAAMDGPGKHEFGFNEAISFMIDCKDQKEVDFFWEELSSNGGEESQCGWVKDRFGVFWQVTPTMLNDARMGNDPIKFERTFAAMLKMKKLNIKTLEQAYRGK